MKSKSTLFNLKKFHKKPYKIYFSIWMAMIQSILKKPELASYPSLNYYYNSKRKLLEKPEDELKLDEIFNILRIHKILADFKINQLKVFESKSIRWLSNGRIQKKNFF